MGNQSKLAALNCSGDEHIPGIRPPLAPVPDPFSSLAGERSLNRESGPLQILHLEDNPLDAELVKQMLVESGLSCEITLVKTRGGFASAFQEKEFDLILSDFSIPGFDGASALFMAQEESPGVPFVFCTGSVGEENATQLLKSGATDFVLKDRLARLPSTVHRALKEASERRQRFIAESSLRESEQFFRAVAGSLGEGLIISDFQGRILYANPRVLEMLGRSWPSLMGQPIAALNILGEKQDLDDGCGKDGPMGTIEACERAIDRPDANPIWAEIHAAPLRNASGEIIGRLIKFSDITERKRAEERMREQAELLDKATDAIYLEDLEHRITYWNKGAERVYGWSASEVMGADSIKYTSGTESKNALSTRKSALENGEWTGELTQIARDGRQIIVESRLTLVRDKSGHPKFILSINTDISHKRQIESQFLRAQRMESIGTLAGGIAHDLNNHLGPIMMAVQLLRMSGTTAEGTKYLDTIETSTRRGADIVKQILSFARGVEGERVQLQLKHLVVEMAGVARETFPRSIQITTRVAKDLRPVLGDSTQLHQILLNLCVNARDAMPEGGVLKIDVENLTVDELFAQQNPGAKAGPHVAITVSDTGTGIPPQIMDRIFDPFFTTKEQNKGTGLGLSTALGIVRSHGGFITVQSEMRKGTRFKVHLPAVNSPAVQAETRSAASLPRGRGESILVVDDEPGMRQIAKQTLEYYGYQVALARDGVDALATFSRPDNRFDLVLTDVAMPHLDGPSLIRVIRRMAPHIRIVAMTGMLDEGALGTPAVGDSIPQLEKPFSAEKLLNIVYNTLHPAMEGREI